MNSRAYAAEAFGTFALTFGVLMSLLVQMPLATPLMAALVLMLFVYTLGPISGAHFNPAVTFGLWSVGKIKRDEALRYWVSQFLGAGLALAFVSGLTGIDVQFSWLESAWQPALAELLGAFFLTFGVASVVYGRVSKDMSGLVIGGSLLFGILAAMGFSNGVLNPAVALGVNSLSLAYLLGPLAGGLLGAQFVNWLAGTSKKKAAVKKAVKAVKSVKKRATKSRAKKK